MKILMMTNSYFPMLGGIEQSIRSFSQAYRKMGHEVLIVAPTPANAQDAQENVIRIPAIEHKKEPKFFINLPLPGTLHKIMRNFAPDIVHSHYPFFMGDYALRLSRQHNIPLVFTYHTMFEHYAYYLPIPPSAAKRFTIKLAAGYANWAQQVIAPSESVEAILRHRGVKAPIEVVPTGVNIKAFAKGKPKEFRRHYHIPTDAFVVGHIGRLAPEKNLKFLIPCLVEFLKHHPKAHALIAGQGASVPMIHRSFQKAGLEKRLTMVEPLHDQELADAYHAMDVFTFASLSETQGMVLTEAMACGTPVVALDANGVREVVRDRRNGRLIKTLDRGQFVKALQWCHGLSPAKKRALGQQARQTAKEFSLDRCARRMISIYKSLRSKEYVPLSDKDDSWREFVERIKAEVDILKNVVEAGEAAISMVKIRDIKKIGKLSDEKSV